MRKMFDNLNLLFSRIKELGKWIWISQEQELIISVGIIFRWMLLTLNEKLLIVNINLNGFKKGLRMVYLFDLDFICISSMNAFM